MKFLAPLVILFFGISSFAQNLSGEVIYAQKMDVSHITEKSMQAQLYRDAAEMTKNFRYRLVFNQEASRFEVEDFVNNDANSLETMALRIGGGRGVFYKHIDSMNTLHQKESIGEDVIVQLPVENISWQITDEKKQIGDYVCYKATASLFIKAPIERLKDKTIHIEAWFTPEIPLCFGPIDMNGLPGLILETTIASTTFTAVEVNLDTSANGLEIEVPTKGTLMTEEELQAKARKRYDEITGKS